MAELLVPSAKDASGALSKRNLDAYYFFVHQHIVFGDVLFIFLLYFLVVKDGLSPTKKHYFQRTSRKFQIVVNENFVSKKK